MSIVTGCSKDWISPPGTITEEDMEESRRVGELAKKALFLHDVPTPPPPIYCRGDFHIGRES